MSNKNVRRGYVQSDEKEFNEQAMKKLKEAQKDIFMLINRAYPIKNAATFVGNHYLLSERQRIALVRATSSSNSLKIRKNKEVEKMPENQIVYIDGFNIIITLEVALSNSTLMECMDGTIRDLAGLRGTYRLIDKTDIAINLIGKKLEQLKISKAVFYLDRPVSNSGNLKIRILELLNKYNFEVDVEIVDNADKSLENLENVISSDAVVIEKSASWFNLVKKIIDDDKENFKYIDFKY